MCRQSPVTEAVQQQTPPSQPAIFSWLQGVASKLELSSAKYLEFESTSSASSSHLEKTSAEEENEKACFNKLKALGKHINKCLSINDSGLIDQCHEFISLDHSLARFQDGLYKADCFVKCMESLHQKTRSRRWGRKSHDTIPETQWQNREPWNMSLRLSRILRQKLGPCSTGHEAMLRLNGFQLEEIGKPPNFNIFFSSCKASCIWRESICTSISK